MIFPHFYWLSEEYGFLLIKKINGNYHNVSTGYIERIRIVILDKKVIIAIKSHRI